MNKSPIDDLEIITIKFNCSFSEKNPKKRSDHFKLSKHPAAGDFYISCVLKYPLLFDISILSLNITVIKTYTKPAMATIKLKLTNMNLNVRIVNDWEQECEFKELPYEHKSQTCLYNLGNCSSPNHTHRFSIGIKCQIIWYGFVDEFFSPNQSNLFPSYSDSMEFCDMKIKVEDKEFPVHKIIVSRSPVLKKTLLANMKESKDNCIDLTDLGLDVVEELLLFIYESRINKAYSDDNLLLELVKVGEMYEIPKLRDYCGMLLSNKLTEDNVLMLLENAHVYNSSILKHRAITYVVVGREKFFSMDEFKELGLRHSGLFFEFCSMLKFFLDS